MTSGVVAAVHVQEKATRLAMEANQVIGERAEYYVTLDQLERILAQCSGPSSRDVLDASKMCPPGSEPLA